MRRSAGTWGCLLLAAVGVRVVTMVTWFPALLLADTHDGAGYIAQARDGLFVGGTEPSGYPAFLALVRAISHALWVTIAVQHALGLAAGVLLTLAVRRLGVPLALALVPAVVVWFNGDELFLEQALLSEALFTFVIALALYAAVRALEGGRRWAAILGAAAAGALVIRFIGAPLAVVLVAGLTVAVWRLRLSWRLAAVVIASAAAALASYSVATRVATGGWSPLGGDRGWNLYARAAEFADCASFTPPPGTRVLCDSTPAARRAGPDYYHWLGGPAIRAFGADHDDRRVGAFAIAAILHQPGAFVALAATDLVRYVDPAFGPRRVGDFGGPGTVAFPAGEPAIDPASSQEVDAYYGPGNLPRGRPSPVMRDYQRYVRFTGPMLFIALILGLAGVFVTTGSRRWAVGIMASTGLVLIVVPTLTGATWRYAVPAEGPFVCAATVTVWMLWQRLRQPTNSATMAAGATEIG